MHGMRPLRRLRSGLLILLLPVVGTTVPSLAADQAAPAAIQISRAQGEIRIDGDLSDPGWQGATRIDTFYETNPGDNVPPSAATTAWLAYDDRYFYAAFEFAEPDMKSLRAAFGDHDNVSGNSHDYGGVILDTRNDGKSAVLLLVNPYNIQYDAISNDASGEDSSLDLYWDSATRLGKDRWFLEMRIPFSSLRYGKGDPQTWGIMLYRNRPRQFRQQILNVKLPRGVNCFVCNEAKLTGLSGLPGGNHVILAPYGTVRRSSAPRDGLGTPLTDGPVKWDGGLDAKWTPNADTAIDATLNPDFSQIESDVPQISTNQRFALFYPEKRPFFLEGLDLFATPLQAVYTRTVTAPRWGVRATGEGAGNVYTFLVAGDRGGGSAIIPGPQSSRLAPQDFASTVVIGRTRYDLGSSFVSFLVTGREIQGGGFNRVAGPDFQWRPSGSDVLTGQALLSDSRTPRRPDLDPEWDGRSLSSHALSLEWTHSTRTVDWNARYQDIGDEFRADAGFLPQVGIRDARANAGYTFYPEHGIFNSVHPFFAFRDITASRGGDLLLRRFDPGVEAHGAWNSYADLEYRAERIRAGSREIPNDAWLLTVQMSPTRTLAQINLNLTAGDAVDYDNSRPGHGTTVGLSAIVRPGDHLELRFDGSRATVDVSPDGQDGGPRRRLFTAQVARLKATWTFSSRSFLRLIGERDQVDRDPGLYTFAVTPRDEAFSGSALFAYKLNWQTVLFLGYGDERALEEISNRLARSGRELFLKVSYAFQR
jgi:Domain of unknown function (DUF5916)